MKATEKHTAIDALLTGIFGKDRKAVVASFLCATCSSEGNTADTFRDDLSRKEYAISGMCQTCQDDFFGVSED
jgi:hypothetical protein